MNVKEVSINKSEITLAITERVDELLHMILDLKQGKETDLYQMQSLILNMYKDQIDAINTICELSNELEQKRRRMLEIPKFMSKEKEAQ